MHKRDRDAPKKNGLLELAAPALNVVHDERETQKERLPRVFGHMAFERNFNKASRTGAAM